MKRKGGFYRSVIFALLFSIFVGSISLPLSQIANAQYRTDPGAVPGGAISGTPVVNIEGEVESGIVEGLLFVVFQVVMGYNRFVLAVSGKAFDFALENFVVKINNFLGVGAADESSTIMGSITELWKIFRDIGNILIIFSLLYLAINIIIQGQGFSQAKAVGYILIAALLINFSLFFTKVAWDFSNQVASSIFESANITNQGSSNFERAIMKNKFYALMEKPTKFDTFKDDKDNESEVGYITQAVFGAVILTAMSFIMIFGVLILLVRVVMFLLLFITSALGLTAKFMPFAKGVGSWWWDNLVKFTLMLPTFAILFFVALKVQDAIATDIDFGDVGLLFAGGTESVAAVTTVSTTLVYFAIMIAFFAVAVFAPLKISTYGGAFANNMFGRAVGWGQGRLKATGRFAGRTTVSTGTLAARKGVGGVARRTADAQWIKRASQKTLVDGKAAGVGGFVARGVLKGANKAGYEYTYDPRNIKIGKKTIGESVGLGKGISSYKKAVEDKQKDLEKKKKTNMELYGLDKVKADPGDLAVAEAARARNEKTYKDAAKNYAQDVEVYGKDSDRAKKSRGIFDNALKEQNATIEKLGALKNKGEAEYLKIANSKANRVVNRVRLNFVENKALANMEKKAKKEWTKGADKKNMDTLQKALKEAGKKDDESKET